MTNHHSATNQSDPQALLNQFVIEYMRDKHRKRRWQWLRRGFFFLFFVWIGYLLIAEKMEDANEKAKSHIGLIDLKGEIFDSKSANSENFSKGLKKAYEQETMKALIIRIDSPGGSPVQADYMYSSIRHYQTKHPNIKVYAVCVDSCASAAYYVASAADEIYANPASIVGSIGVLYNGFGFVDLMQKIGVSRRLQTSGKHKGFMDEFSPLQPTDQTFLQSLLDQIHELFIQRVKDGRGDRLKIDENIFSGLFWTGEQAKTLGLIDGLASSGQVAREIIKIETVVDYTYKQNVLDRMAKNLGTAIADQLPIALGIKPGFQ